jgi:glutamate racemase
VPYGSRSVEEIRQRCFTIADFLIEKGCFLIVVACNTATSAAIGDLRARYPHIIFVGMEPAVKPAGEHSKTGHIGVLATKVTAEGKRLHDAIETFATDIEVHTVIGDGLVELVEEGKAESADAQAHLRTYLTPLLEKNIDQLILGCTHYSFLIKPIRKIVGDKVTIVDPTPSVVKRVAQLLQDHDITPRTMISEPQLFTSGSDLEYMETFYRKIDM